MATALAPGITTSSPAAALSSPAVDTTLDANDPSIPSAAYLRMQPRWEKCRACFIGTEAIRAGGEDYLIRYGAESDDDYEVRLNLAAFYNAYARTVLASVGMLLEEEPTLGADMPPELVALWENIDAQGTHGWVFSRKLATAGIVDSYAGILVEHTNVNAPTLDRSKASAAAVPGRPVDASDERALGLRPYFLLYKADDVIKALYETRNGVRTLTLLILREITTERVGLFGTQTITQYRIYTNERGTIRSQLWKQPVGGGRASLAEGPFVIANQTEIPWSAFVAGDEIAQGEYKPPLIDLADLNIQYHNSLTNHLSLQALAYVPTQVRIGAARISDPNDANVGEYPPITLGPRSTIEAPVIDGVAQPVYWHSPPVDVLDAGERTLTSTKADMGTLGGSFMSAETRAAETAEGKRIDSGAQRATLGNDSIALKDCLERAFGYAAKYRKLQGGSVTLNADFTGEDIDPQYLSVLVNAFQDDVLTLAELRYVIKTGQLPEDFDPEDKKILDQLLTAAAARAEQLRIAAEAKAAGSGGGLPVADATGGG